MEFTKHTNHVHGGAVIWKAEDGINKFTITPSYPAGFRVKVADNKGRSFDSLGAQVALLSLDSAIDFCTVFNFKSFKHAKS